MEPSKNYEKFHYNAMGNRKEGLGSANRRFQPDPSSSVNTNVRPPEYNVAAGTKPIQNFSIQTGEEFNLEFVQERLNPRKPFVPSTNSDPTNAAGYMDLKGILGISHAGSESGSDISMFTAVENNRMKDFGSKGSVGNESRSYYESSRSVPQSSSRNSSNQGTVRGYGSSVASENSLNKVKFLCSFGGKILPRPSDGKLRYVGGETRIIRISKDISWQELVQKTVSLYNQTHTIKYQLPGEELDALVSVSCDEDLQNMLEECSVIDQRGQSRKPRMFLVSANDFDDPHFGLGSTEGSSETQYLVAINGMDLGPRRSSSEQLANNSANDYDHLLGLNVERETNRVALDSTETSLGLLTGSLLPPLTTQSSHPVMINSSSAYQTHSQSYQGQVMHHVETERYPFTAVNPLEGFHDAVGRTVVPQSLPSQFGQNSHPSSYTASEALVPKPVRGLLTQQGGMMEGQLHGGLGVKNADIPLKEPKWKADVSDPRKNELEQNWSSEKEYPLFSKPFDGPVPAYAQAEGLKSVASAPERVTPTLSSNKQEVSVLPSSSLHAEQNYLSHEENQDTSAGYSNSEADSTDFTNLEPPLVQQRVFRSERVPHKQPEQELQNRLSKSDDSFGSQFLMSHSRSGILLQESITESVDKVHEENLVSPAEPSIPSENSPHTNPSTIGEGLVQFEKFKELADVIGKTNPLETKFDSRRTELSHVLMVPVDEKDAGDSDRIDRPQVINPHDSEIGKAKINHKELSVDQADTSKLGHPSIPQGGYMKNNEDLASSLPKLQWGELASKPSNATNKVERPNDFPQTGPTRDFSHEDPSLDAQPKPLVGDILIDINDRFPRDFLSDIFSKAGDFEDSSNIGPLHGDGAGISSIMENHDPKRWSFFHNLAQGEFGAKDVSLIDQDHIGFSPLAQVDGAPRAYHFSPSKADGVALENVDAQVGVKEIQPDPAGNIGTHVINQHVDYDPSQARASEQVQFDGTSYSKTMEKIIPESEYEDGKLETGNIGDPLLDVPLELFDINTLQLIKNDDLEELKELGSGTFGTVYHGKWRGTDVAIKRIKKSCFTGRSSEQERLTLEFWREAEILSKLHHPNVVAFYGVVQDGPGGTLATVTEFMVNGSLRHVLLRKDRYLDLRKRLIIAMDAAFGMEYLHSKNIVHFDLKCDNLLVNLKDPQRPICKVGDFGLSKIKRNTLVTGGVRGTLPWMAPELLNGSSSKVSEKVDVFSFGIVLWEILTGEEPYANMHYGAIIGGIVSNTLRPPVPGYCDPEWKRLMEQCWAPDPVVRPSFTEIASRLRIMSVNTQSKPHGHHAAK
ncbi:hypothetical protein Syun_010804 [Stephania yunnanensis]|uniref:Protein kinase domain-containing protein n=1 Tax=Stephania yunnanensis TaxID=152371 RepID=A0AAP0KI40_9MAGN